MEMLRSHRMIDCLCVCGIDIDASAKLKNQEFRWVTSLQFVRSERCEVPNQKHLEITTNLYLKINFCEKGKLPIVDVEFFTFDEEEAQMVVTYKIIDKLGADWQAVVYKKEQKPAHTGGNKELHNDVSSSRLFNIKPFLQDKRQTSKGLVLCYRCEDNMDQAISDLQLLQGQHRGDYRRSIDQKQILNVPNGYKPINQTFIIRNRNKYLMYRRVPSKLDHAYPATLIESYPARPQSVPQFCFPEGLRISLELRGFITFSFVLTLQTRQRIFCSCLIIKQQLPLNAIKKLGLKKDRKYFSQKAICLLSEFSYPDHFCELLQYLYRVSMSKNDIPFYKVVENLVDTLLNVDEDSFGKLASKYSYGGCNIVFQTSKHYPVISEKSIYCLFKFLQLDRIISVFEALLLEKRIFLASQSKTVLGLVCQALTGLLFPFRWEQVYIPVLPASLQEYTEAPVPFLIGVAPGLLQLSEERQPECIIVDLDNNQVVNDESLPPMPDKIHKQLRKRLSAYEVYSRKDVREYLQNPENTYLFKMRTIENPDFDCYDIRDSFFQFNLTLMKNYRKFEKKLSKGQAYKDVTSASLEVNSHRQISQLFNIPEFLNDLGMTKIGSFAYKFTQTSIFISFIEERFHEKKNHPHYLFFDDSIEKKKNKKDQKLITQVQIQEFIAGPMPDWTVQKGVSYTYDRFPSILRPVEGVDLQAQHIEIDVEKGEADQNQFKALLEYLHEKAANYKGFYRHSYEGGIKYDVPISENLAQLISVLFTRSYEEQIYNEISQKLQTKRLKQLQILQIVTERLDLQDRTCHDTIERLMKFQHLPKYKVELIDVSRVTFKQLVQLKKDKRVIVGETMHGDFLKITFQKTCICFSQSQVSQDLKRIYLHLQSQPLKCVLNRVIGQHLQAFTLFAIEHYLNVEVVSFSFHDLIEFTKWPGFDNKKI